jgi:hypothetical protein
MAFQYDGSNDGHTIANPDVGSLVFSLSFWIYIDTIAEGEIISYGDATGQGWGVALLSDGTLRIRTYDGGLAGSYTSTVVLAEDTWQHVCIVKNGTFGNNIYVDGDNTDDEDFALDAGAIQISSDDFVLALPIVNDPAEVPACACALAHVAYWVDDLLSTEVSDIADKSTSPADIQSGDLAIFLKLNVSPAVDSSSNTFTVTTNDSPSLISSPSGLPGDSEGITGTIANSAAAATTSIVANLDIDVTGTIATTAAKATGAIAGTLATAGDRAYLYNGSTDNHTLANINKPSTIFTFATWIYVSSLAEGLVVNYANGTDGAAGRGFSVTLQADGSFRLRTYSGSDALNYTTNAQITAGTWYHIAYVKGGTFANDFYLNGSNTLDASFGQDAPTPQNSTDDFIVAGTMPNDLAEFSAFGGALCHTCYWDEVLTSTEVGHLADKTLCPDVIEAANIQVFLKLSETPAIDSSPNAFTVTTNGSPTITTGASGLPCGVVSDLTGEALTTAAAATTAIAGSLAIGVTGTIANSAAAATTSIAATVPIVAALANTAAAALTAIVANIPSGDILDIDYLDATSGGFNPMPGTYLNASAYEPSVYTTAGTTPFTTPTAEGITAPSIFNGYIGLIQWANIGSTDDTPWQIIAAGEGSFEFTEFYFQFEVYIPTGFPWCGGKLFRFGRQESGSFVGDYGVLEGSADTDSEPDITLAPLAPYFGTFDNAPYSPSGEDITYTSFPARDEWVKIGIWAKWNTYTSGVANSDGFCRLFYNNVLDSSSAQENKIWSTSDTHAGGFNTLICILNHSYGVCGLPTAYDSIYVSGAELYETQPGVEAGVTGTIAGTLSAASSILAGIVSAAPYTGTIASAISAAISSIVGLLTSEGVPVVDNALVPPSPILLLHNQSKRQMAEFRAMNASNTELTAAQSTGKRNAYAGARHLAWSKPSAVHLAWINKTNGLTADTFVMVDAVNYQGTNFDLVKYSTFPSSSTSIYSSSDFQGEFVGRLSQDFVYEFTTASNVQAFGLNLPSGGSTSAVNSSYWCESISLNWPIAIKSSPIKDTIKVGKKTYDVEELHAVTFDRILDSEIDDMLELIKTFDEPVFLYDSTAHILKYKLVHGIITSAPTFKRYDDFNQMNLQIHQLRSYA